MSPPIVQVHDIGKSIITHRACGIELVSLAPQTKPVKLADESGFDRWIREFRDVNP